MNASDDEEQRDGGEARPVRSAPVGLGAGTTNIAVHAVVLEDRKARRRELVRVARIAGGVFIALIVVAFLTASGVSGASAKLRVLFVEVQMFDAEYDCGYTPRPETAERCAVRDARVVEMWRLMNEPTWAERMGDVLRGLFSLDDEAFTKSLPAQRIVVEKLARRSPTLRAEVGLPAIVDATSPEDFITLLSPGLGLPRRELLALPGVERMLDRALRHPESRIVALHAVTRMWQEVDTELTWPLAAAPAAALGMESANLTGALVAIDVLASVEPALAAASAAVAGTPESDHRDALWRARAGGPVVDVLDAYNAFTLDETVTSLARLLRPRLARATSDERAALLAWSESPTTRGAARVLLNLAAAGADDALGKKACRELHHQLVHNPSWTLSRYTFVAPNLGCPLPATVAADLATLAASPMSWPAHFAALYGRTPADAPRRQEIDDHVARLARLAAKGAPGTPRVTPSACDGAGPCRRPIETDDVAFGAWLRAEW